MTAGWYGQKPEPKETLFSCDRCPSTARDMFSCHHCDAWMCLRCAEIGTGFKRCRTCAKEGITKLTEGAKCSRRRPER